MIKNYKLDYENPKMLYDLLKEKNYNVRIEDFKNCEMYRIIYTEDYLNARYKKPVIHVEKGQLGGWVQSKNSLSINETSYIDEDSIVLNDSYIIGSSVIINSFIFNNSLISGNSYIKNMVIDNVETNKNVEIESSKGTYIIKGGKFTDDTLIEDSLINAKNIKVSGTSCLIDSTIDIDEEIIIDNSFIQSSKIKTGINLINSMIIKSKLINENFKNPVLESCKLYYYGSKHKLMNFHIKNAYITDENFVSFKPEINNGYDSYLNGYIYTLRYPFNELRVNFINDTSAKCFIKEYKKNIQIQSVKEISDINNNAIRIIHASKLNNSLYKEMRK